MKKIGFLLAAAIAAVSVGFFAPAASADTDVCVGAGRATLSGGIGLPGTKTTRTFTITLDGACLVKVSLSATGTVTGACGQSRGTGVTNNGHSFAWTSVGTLLILTGQVTGVVTAFADPTVANNSCANGTAHEFQVQGAALKSCHSPVVKQRTTVAGPPVNADVWICVGL